MSVADPVIDPTLLALDQSNNNAKKEEPDAEMADLFGNDEDIEEVEPEEPKENELPPEEQEKRRALEYEEEDIPAEIAVEVQEAEVRFPNVPMPSSSSGENWVIRMPPYILVDSKPFHPDSYMGPEEEEPQSANSREQSLTIKLKVENTIRWRWTKDHAGNDVRQSNSRVIRWSDGSLSLRLGKELYDINQTIDTSAGVQRQSLGASASQSSNPTHRAQIGKTQGLTYLVAQHKRSQVLQAETAVTGHMTLQPTSMQSEAHQNLVRAVGQKHKKLARLKMTSEPTIDPERELAAMRKQDDKMAKKRQAEVGMGSGGVRGRKSTSKRQRRDTAVWSDESEVEEDVYGAFDDSDEEEESPERVSRRKTSASKKGAGETDYQEDDFVVADEDEDEEAGGRKSKRQVEDEDDLDKMDKDIEAQVRKKRHRDAERAKVLEHAGDEDVDGVVEGKEKPVVESSGTSSAPVDDAMMVESEDDDDFQIRKVRGGGKIAVEDEDEE